MTMGDLNVGLPTWRRATNHNRMIDLQGRAGAMDPAGAGPVRIAYFASSAFRITSPEGITVMVDPWRNLPTGKWDWYFHDMPVTEVDIGCSTHAHFDHDALNRLDAHVLLDRPIGRFEFGDVAISGVADKHATDATYATYDFRAYHLKFSGVDIAPPDNPRSWDNTTIVVETGGLRILHWGDNRHNPPDAVWEMLGEIDIALLPVDDSQHVMGYPMVESIIERLQPKIVIPHHYYVEGVLQRQSTLLPVDKWLATQPRVTQLAGAEATFSLDGMPAATEVHSFGTHVAFDADAWRNTPEG
jgi:L-ascorbate metabolism protein UlaG (beta-lactamase superfamily)